MSNTYVAFTGKLSKEEIDFIRNYWFNKYSGNKKTTPELLLEFTFKPIMTREEALTIIENCEGPELYEVYYPQSMKELNELLSAKRKVLTLAYKTLANNA